MYEVQHVSPLYPEVEWDMPEHRNHAPKLLIIGGSRSSFALPIEAYQIATKFTLNKISVVMPDVLLKIVGDLPGIFYVPSNHSGSIASDAFDRLLAMSSSSQGVIISGNLGQNSETTLLIEKLLDKIETPTLICEDAVDEFVARPEQLLSSPNIVLALELKQIQKIAKKLRLPLPFTSTMQLNTFAASLKQFDSYKSKIITQFGGGTWVLADQKLSFTPWTNSTETLLQVSTKALVYLISNPLKAYEAMTASQFTKLAQQESDDGQTDLAR